MSHHGGRSYPRSLQRQACSRSAQQQLGPNGTHALGADPCLPRLAEASPGSLGPGLTDCSERAPLPIHTTPGQRMLAKATDGPNEGRLATHGCHTTQVPMPAHASSWDGTDKPTCPSWASLTSLLLNPVARCGTTVGREIGQLQKMQNMVGKHQSCKIISSSQAPAGRAPRGSCDIFTNIAT